MSDLDLSLEVKRSKSFMRVTPFKIVVETHDKNKIKLIQFSKNNSKYDYGCRTEFQRSTDVNVKAQRGPVIMNRP